MSFLASFTLLRRPLYTHQPITRRFTTSRSWASKPLRILFCGSDELSIASLRAVHAEKLRDPSSIASLDVLLRPGKPQGRGLHLIREVPLKRVAQALKLHVYERDTFTGWNLPKPDGEPINLIIAVSFGLFVPPRILKSAEYGGINIHPSFLPDLRGPAPLYRALLNGDEWIGVTLQTLHHEKFDHGNILAQTQRPGFRIPNPSKCNHDELVNFIAPKAAHMLVSGIRDRLFIANSQGTSGTGQAASTHEITISAPSQKVAVLRPAPKVTTEDRRIDWLNMSMDEILRRDRLLDGTLWSWFNFDGLEKERIAFEGIKGVKTSLLREPPAEMKDGEELAGVDAAHSFTRWNTALKMIASGNGEPGDIYGLRIVDASDRNVTIPCTVHKDKLLVPLYSGDAISIDWISIGGMRKRASSVIQKLIRNGKIHPFLQDDCDRVQTEA